MSTLNNAALTLNDAAAVTIEPGEAELGGVSLRELNGYRLYSYAALRPDTNGRMLISGVTEYELRIVYRVIGETGYVDVASEEVENRTIRLDRFFNCIGSICLPIRAIGKQLILMGNSSLLCTEGFRALIAL